jgi:hypothetical protein
MCTIMTGKTLAIVQTFSPFRGHVRMSILQSWEACKNWAFGISKHFSMVIYPRSYTYMLYKNILYIFIWYILWYTDFFLYRILVGFPIGSCGRIPGIPWEKVPATVVPKRGHGPPVPKMWNFFHMEYIWYIGNGI